MSVADIARRLGRRYHMVWIEARKLMADAKKVRVRAVERPAPTVELEVLEVFAELQGIVPEHLRR
ncbi:MAG: hypothetical protein IT381_12530 [Deltaproteobacteria bacterium]|nr:hypothetical protein [Deltaproteobacteria bacterium]